MADSDSNTEQVNRAQNQLWFEALLDNAVKTVDPWVQSTGFRFNFSRHRSFLFDVGARLGETFLLNTRLIREDRETVASIARYFSDTGQMMLSLNGIEATTAEKEIALPEGAEASLRLSRCLARRRSQRTYTGDKVDFNGLATIIRAGAGITHKVKTRLRNPRVDSLDLSFRSVPSPGGLYGIDIYIAAQHVRGLDPGLYCYSPRRDALLLIETGTGVADRLCRACMSPDFDITHSRAAALFFLVGRPWKVLRKYGDRGIRYLFIEAGEITQSIHLASVAIGLGSVESASFFDDEINAGLKVDGGTATILHMILVGVSAEI